VFEIITNDALIQQSSEQLLDLASKHVVSPSIPLITAREWMGGERASEPNREVVPNFVVAIRHW